MIIISNIISFILITYIANSFLKPRYSHRKHICILILIVIVFSIVNHNGTSPLKAIILLSLYFCYIFLLFKGKLIHKFLVIFPFFIIQIVSEILVGYFISNIPFLNLSKTTTSIEYILGIILSNIFFTLFTFVYVNVSKSLKIKNLPKYAWLIFILPIVTIILLASVNDYFILFKSNPNMFIYISILALSNLILVIIFILALNSTHMKNELEIAKQKQELINSKFNLLTQHYNYNFNFLHDLLHTCNKINLFLDSSDYSNAKDEVKNLTEITYKKFNAIYSNSFILNYAINNNLNKIIENKINIKTVFEYINFENLDFNTQLDLFNFLVNFSIDCCMKVDISQRIIIIKSKTKSNYLIIQILLPNIKINDNEIKEETKKILHNIDYSVNIKKIASSSMSLLISFPIHTNN